MACIKSAQRSALAAFAPESPYLAAATMAGAVDLSFSSSANLEIYHLDFQSESPDLPVVAACAAPERFHRLSWSKHIGSDLPLGLVAGGLTDGSIGIWNPYKMIHSKSQDGSSLEARLEKHAGPVRGVEFCALSPNLLASGADEGEICIWDLSKLDEPSLFPPIKGASSNSQTEISFVSWNPKFQHILASTSYNGIAVVWDLRTQKAITSISEPNRRRISVLQWNPDVSTNLIVASDDDNSPSLKVYDVRKAMSPMREFVGHTKGVIAMSWCPYDSSLLLTCAKDNRTLCWDAVNGEIVCELPASTNSNFDVHWYPKIPGVISASSFDVKIGIYNIEACNKYNTGEGSTGSPARMRAPKWLKCPAGASFGFGGKFVSFRSSASGQGAATVSSEVYVQNLALEQGLARRSTEFELAIKKGDKSLLRDLCDMKCQESKFEEDKETWGFLKVMFDEDGAARTKLLSHLGFNIPEEGSKDSSDVLGNTLADTLKFDNGTPSHGGFLVDHGEDFFNNPQIADDSSVSDNKPSVGDKKIAEKPEELMTPADPSIDESIQRALVVGDYKLAVAQCVAANRMADALVIAHVGGSSLWESTRDQYLGNSLSPYLKIVAARVNNDLMTLVNTWPLHAWKETLALLCTFAEKNEWTALCDTLASRLMTVGNTLAATLCYICAGNIDKTVEIWSRTLKSDDGDNSYIDLLQDLMEKTIVLALATGHKHFSTSLSKLVENYAELLASQGLLSTAMEYLNLLKSDGYSTTLNILRERISLSIQQDTDSSKFSVDGGAAQATPMEHASQQQQQQQQQQHPYHFPQVLHPQATMTDHLYNHGYQPSIDPSHLGGPGVPQNPQAAATAFRPPQPQMFMPAPVEPISQQASFGSVTAPQPASFVPASLPALRNASQYQQPSLGAQLYQTSPSPTLQPTAPMPSAHSGGMTPLTGTGPNQFSQATPTRFMPMANQFTQRPTGPSPIQPSSPTQPPPQPQAAPPAPAPTIQTADTSRVPVNLRPVIITLNMLYEETSRALGGPQAIPAKKREIEENSRKIGLLFTKLNSGDISPAVSESLISLCAAVDAGDFQTAGKLQNTLTGSHWDECGTWLGALRRMIKIRQSSVR